jgi:radical SAM protein with 4Fe4S-binding SPASM domain
MEKISPKVQAVFGQGNIDRVRRIVESKGDENKLALISPSFIVMDLTWRCNYHCGDCIDENVVNKSNQELPIELIEDIFDYSKISGVRGIMTMGGEVFLYEEGMKKVMEKSREYKIPIKTVSNGSRLGEFIPEIIETYKIPGSMLRISINSDRENYMEQTGGNIELEDILASIKNITSQGTPVYVSTIVFPESSKRDHPCRRIIPNIRNLQNIIQDCEEAGVKTHILIPARDPKTRKRYQRADEEREFMDGLIKENRDNKTELEAGEFVYSKKRGGAQNLDFDLCPSGFIFTLIGSDGKVYKCTDNRGKDSAVLGQIAKPRDFEKFWHSNERVKAQKCTECANDGCIRYKVNCMLDSAIRNFKERGSQGDILESFEQKKIEKDYIWI